MDERITLPELILRELDARGWGPSVAAREAVKNDCHGFAGLLLKLLAGMESPDADTLRLLAVVFSPTPLEEFERAARATRKREEA